MDSAPPRPPQARLTTGDVALRLGVAPATLRSWDRRYGLGPSGREDGRHRRWTEQDIAVLERMCELTARGVPTAEAAHLARAAARLPRQAHPAPEAPAPEAAPPNDATIARRRVRGLGRAAVRLDAPLLDEILTDTLTEHSVPGAWEGVLNPALRAIGRTWARSGDTQGERFVEAEHMLSWHISTALRRATPLTAPTGNRRPVLLACAPGEAHTLALEALGAALGERNVPVRMFGAAVPMGALAEAVRRTGPGAVVLWSQLRGTADRALLPVVRGAGHGLKGSRVHPALLVAGPGWSSRPAEADHRPSSLTQAVEILEGLDAFREVP